MNRATSFTSYYVQFWETGDLNNLLHRGSYNVPCSELVIYILFTKSSFLSFNVCTQI